MMLRKHKATVGGTVMEAYLYDMYKAKGLEYVREFITKKIIEDEQF